MDFKLSNEQVTLQKKAREFAFKEILPVTRYFDENDQMPTYLVKKAHDSGLINLTIEKKYGGPGHGLMESALVVEEIAAACPALATSLFGNTLGQEPLMMSENEQAKEKYLPIFVKEPKIISFATSEPMMGSDIAGMRCLARKDGDDYILNGTKYWITNGGYADYVSVFATVDTKARHDGICAFLVEMDWDGVSVGEHIPKLGQRLSNTVAIKFKDCRVPAENILAGPGDGFKLAMKTFSRTRPIIGSFAVGAARSAMEFAIDHAKKRRAFGQKLSAFQNTAFKIAEMYQKIETMRLLTWKAAWEADNGLDPTLTASLAKFYTTEAAQEVVNSALQIFAGYGYTKFLPVEKILRDLRVLTIYEGTSEIQRIVVSKFVLSSYKTVMPALEDLPSLTADDPEKAAREGMPKQTAWRCRICGHIHYGDEPPDECPYCRFPKSAFKKVWPRE
ncbi:MAG: acyl-CoA dehydrogenase family protein [Promethearchaeota archaeon]